MTQFDFLIGECCTVVHFCANCVQCRAFFLGKKQKKPSKNSCDMRIPAHTHSCVILGGLNNEMMEEFLSPCSFECVIACLGAAV